MNYKSLIPMILGSLALTVATPVKAQQPVPALQDLIGVRGRDGETQLQQRGYEWQRTTKGDDRAYSFYTEPNTDQCVQVVTYDGRYEAILYVPEFDCGEGNQNASAVRKETFQTVCGSITNQQTFSNLCEVTNEYKGDRKVKTLLRFPDMDMQFVWGEADNVTIKIEGSQDIQATYSTSEGETDIFTDEKTYFYISDPGMAASEVEHF